MIYVVIPHYILNEDISKLAKNAIESFKGCFVISVNDNSPYSTECLKGSDLVINRKKNGGFAKCMNTGFRKALSLAKKDDWIICANNDIEATGNWIEEAERCFRDFNADIVGGLGYRTREFPPIDDMRVSEGGMYKDWMFPGGFYIAKKSFLKDCGLYDENYAHGGIEDIDLFYVGKQKGKRFIMTPRIQYWHKEGATRYSDTQRGIQREQITKNEQYFLEKYGFHPITGLNQILTCNYLNP